VVCKKLLIGCAVVVVVFLLMVAHSRFREHHAPVSRHSLAPDFVLPDISDGNLQLSAYRGKVVLLDFWATWCEPCREETPHFVELQHKYGDQGLQIIGVSMDDDAAPVREFYTQFKVNYPVVMGNAKTGELYGGILGLPVAFLIAPDGTISVRHDGALRIDAIDAEIKELLASSPDEKGSSPSREPNH
jgi:thiol-disulfide isomerase/thioredoxin